MSPTVALLAVAAFILASGRRGHSPRLRQVQAHRQGAPMGRKEGGVMGAGPHGGVHGQPRREPAGAPQWSDNVARMRKFTERHPEVEITVPMKNGTDDFIATWPGGDVRDRSLGWLMDNLEERFDRG